MRTLLLGSFYLLPVVGAALLTDVMRNLGLATLGASTHGGWSKCVMRSAFVAAGL